MSWPTRKQALQLLRHYTKNENLVKHALAVEAAMRDYAERMGGDPERWGVVGLLHDFDYERYPTLEDHPFRGAEILREEGYDEALVRGVLAHASHTGIARETEMEKAIYAVDELTGLITAVALVRPSKKIADVKPKSIRKKWKDKAFAAGVDRREIEEGAEQLGIPLDQHIANVLESMKRIADDLGL